MSIKRIARTTIATVLLTSAAAAMAYDKPPKAPPSSGTGGSSSGPVSVPEPEQFALFALGIAGLAAGRVLAKRRRRG